MEQHKHLVGHGVRNYGAVRQQPNIVNDHVQFSRSAFVPVHPWVSNNIANCRSLGQSPPFDPNFRQQYQQSQFPVMSFIYPLYNSFLPNGMMFPSALSTELGAFDSPFDSGNQNPYLKVLGNPMNPFLNRMSYNDEVLSVFTILVLIFFMLTPTV